MRLGETATEMLEPCSGVSGVRISPMQAFVAGWIGMVIIIALLLATTRVMLP
jgi:hypothetical protein